MPSRLFPNWNRRNAPGAGPAPSAATPATASTEATQHRDAMLAEAQRHVTGNAALTDDDRQRIDALITGANRLTDAGQPRSAPATPPATAPAAGTRIEPVASVSSTVGTPSARELAMEARFAAMEANYQRMMDQVSGGRRSAPLPTDDPNAHRGRRFNLMRVVRSRVDQTQLDGLEAETSQEIARRNGRSPQGVFVPWSAILPQRSELRAASTGTAGSLIQTDVLVDEIALLLRAQTIFGQLGGRILPGLMGPMSIPRQTAGSAATFVGENTAGAESNFSTGNVTLTPRSITARNFVTRLQAQQTGDAIHDLVAEDIRRSMAIGIDGAVFTGTGIAPNPEGILADTDVPTIALGTNGAALDWQKVLDIERDVANANALSGTLGWATTNNVRSKLKATVKFAGTYSPIWEITNGREEINGFPALSSTQLPFNLVKGTSGAVCSAAIFGDWSQCLLALWNEIDLLVDPYTQAAEGNIRLIAFQECDYVTRQPQSLRKVVDILTT